MVTSSLRWRFPNLNAALSCLSSFRCSYRNWCRSTSFWRLSHRLPLWGFASIRSLSIFYFRAQKYSSWPHLFQSEFRHRYCGISAKLDYFQFLFEIFDKPKVYFLWYLALNFKLDWPKYVSQFLKIIDFEAFFDGIQFLDWTRAFKAFFIFFPPLFFNFLDLVWNL